MADRLRGKVALVTGAAQGIGAAIGTLMAAEGATVIATDITSERSRSGVEEADDVLGLDVADADAWASAARHVEARYGRLDVLVNNAGVATSQALETCTLDDWRLHMAVNAEGPFLGD